MVRAFASCGHQATRITQREQPFRVGALHAAETRSTRLALLTTISPLFRSDGLQRCLAIVGTLPTLEHSSSTAPLNRSPKTDL